MRHLRAVRDSRDSDILEHTALKIWNGLGEQSTHPVYILDIVGTGGLWQQTIYKAVSLGYLDKRGTANYVGTVKLVNVVREAQRKQGLSKAELGLRTGT